MQSSDPGVHFTPDPPPSIPPQAIHNTVGTKIQPDDFSEPEREILYACKEKGEAWKLGAGCIGSWVRAGKKDFLNQADRAYQARYLEAFDILVYQRRYFRHEGGMYYQLTGTGFDKARQIENPNHDTPLPLSPKAFHVLKWFNQINPDTGAGNVEIVAYSCEIDAREALACIQELWDLKFIKTAIVMPGEWKSHYAITQAGRNYVTENAT